MILDCDLVLLAKGSGVCVEKGIFKALDLQLGMMMMHLVHGQLCVTALPPLRGYTPVSVSKLLYCVCVEDAGFSLHGL